MGAWDDCQIIQASDGSDGYWFGRSVSINEKIGVAGAPCTDNGNGPYSGAVYTFTLQGETWTEDKIFTASDMALSDGFGISVAISGDTLLVGAYGKDASKGAAYVFVHAGDGSWDEVTRLIPIYGIASGDYFGWSVALSGDSALIEAVRSDENGDNSW